MTTTRETSLIRWSNSLGIHENMRITSIQSTDGSECGVSVTGPRGALAGDVRGVPVSGFDEMEAAFSRELDAAKAEGWKVEYTRDDGPGDRSVRTPPEGVYYS